MVSRDDLQRLSLDDDAPQGASELKAMLGAWIPTGERLPDDETPVLILFYDGKRKIGELRWDHPGFEDNYKAFRYWDDPDNDGQDWEWNDIVGWLPLPEAPNAVLSGAAPQQPKRHADEPRPPRTRG